MARPSKNNCDYFPHDNGMRNHPKVKAIRNKFDNGYAIWVMLLEYLTASDGNVFEYSELQFELLSGDFGFSVTEIREVVDYSLKLEMLFNKNGFINSDSLDERLMPVYEKRGKAKEISAKQKRVLGKFATNDTVDTVVSVTEMPQSKVNKNKGNKTNNIKFDFFKSLLELGVEDNVARDWMLVRKNKNAANTQTAFKAIAKEISISGLTANECIEIAVVRSWQGFKAEWIKDKNKFQTHQEQQNIIPFTLNGLKDEDYNPR